MLTHFIQFYLTQVPLLSECLNFCSEKKETQERVSENSVKTLRDSVGDMMRSDYLLQFIVGVELFPTMWQIGHLYLILNVVIKNQFVYKHIL